MKPKKSLRSRINLIFLIVWLIIFFMQAIYIAVQYRRAYTDAQAAFENTMSSAHSVLTDKVQISAQLLKGLIDDQNIEKYFQCTDKNQQKQMWQSLVSPIKNAYSITSEQYYALSFDNMCELIDSSSGTTKELIHAAHNAYDFFDGNKENLVFYSTSGTPFTDMYFFSFQQIKTPDPDRIGMKFLGTVVVAGKVNKAEFMRESGLDKKVRLVLRFNGDEETDVELIPGLEEGSNYFYKTQNVDSSNWVLCGSAALSTPISSGLILLIAETIFMSALFLVIQLYIKRNVFSPLYKISDFLNDYSLTKKKSHLNLQNDTEIGIIANKIDEMIERIESLSRHIVQTQQRLYESEIAQKDASLYALQAQLNPHFMYNTLDCICGIANVSGTPQIADVAVALATMLRYSLSGKTIVPLTEEIEIVKNYLSIMEVRHPNFFTAEFNISPAAEELMCPKMLLQPIIENTFKHGFVPRTKNAHIVISANVDTDRLIITIFDNGKGFPKEILSELLNNFKQLNNSFYLPSNNSTHIGLINIQSRIRLNYGKDYGLNIESEEGKFSKIILNLPIISKDENQDVNSTDVHRSEDLSNLTQN